MIRTLGEFAFVSVGTPTFELDGSGKVVEYTHQLSPEVRAHSYAAGPFCRFTLREGRAEAGVYAITVEDELQYIGECDDLSRRCGPTGYGHISARNCHHDGQATNCKVNALILAAARTGREVRIWFHRSDRRKDVERELLSALHPPWNGRMAVTNVGGSRPNGGTPILSRTVFEEALNQEFLHAERKGIRRLTVRAGDLHHTVGGYPGRNHRMPLCCEVMKARMRAGDRVVTSPPSGTGADLTIEYGSGSEHARSVDEQETAIRDAGDLLLACGTEASVLPPTALYNEGWMLRLTLEAFHDSAFAGELLSPDAAGQWFSEGLLPSQFLARTRGDHLAEGWTHADGVLGHFAVSRTGRSEVTLAPRAAQFIVIEAKLGSGLSGGTKHAPFYNQAARSVACMAEVFDRAASAPTSLRSVAFLVLAPASQIGPVVRTELLSKDSLRATVEKRVAMYIGTPEETAKRGWFDRAFLPLLEVITTEAISWESLLETVARLESPAAPALRAFYERCLLFCTLADVGQESRGQRLHHGGGIAIV